uniref:Holocyclotoxin 12 n=1 Tax=Ixodes holocyclus TaxID=65647 RepID=A0A1B0T6P1_IXOHO|nr:holocyclotoxin 12 [Ixodes holocyclus]
MAKFTAALFFALIILAIVQEGSAGCSNPGKKNCNADCYTHCDCSGGEPHDFGAGPKLCTSCTYQPFKSVGYCK